MSEASQRARFELDQFWTGQHFRVERSGETGRWRILEVDEVDTDRCVSEFAWCEEAHARFAASAPELLATLAAEVERLEGENAKLRACLKPFAAHENIYTVRMEDIRRAREALKGES